MLKDKLAVTTRGYNLVSRTKDEAKHPMMHKTAPWMPTKPYPAPEFNTVETGSWVIKETLHYICIGKS